MRLPMIAVLYVIVVCAIALAIPFALRSYQADAFMGRLARRQMYHPSSLAECSNAVLCISQNNELWVNDQFVSRSIFHSLSGCMFTAYSVDGLMTISDNLPHKCLMDGQPFEAWLRNAHRMEMQP